MSANAIVKLLGVAFMFQAALPLAAPNLEATGNAVQQAATKQKSLSVNWLVHIPLVACENGVPILNIEVPVANAPVAICPGFRPPDVLPQAAPTSTSASQDEAYQVGTVIVLGVSHEKVVMAADSRNVLLTTKLLPDGTTDRKIKYDDCACKLTQLTPTMLFAADGQVAASSSIPASVLYDAHKLASLAARSYRSNPQEEQHEGGQVAAIATRWAWDIDFRMHHGFANGWTPIQTLQGIFAGLEPNGEVAIAVATLEYPRPRSSIRVPPVTFTVGTFQSTPTDFTWVEAFGMKDVAETYYATNRATAQTFAENKRLSRDILKAPKSFSPKVPEQLVDLTIQHYEAAAGQDGLLLVHGPTDLAVLRRKKKIKWIHWKKCSGAHRTRSAVADSGAPQE